MIRFDHVCKKYANGTNAIRNLSLTIPDGQLLVLLGSSGCGKTTLLRLINRLVEPTSGHIFIHGTDTSTVNPVQLRRQIGYVLQGGGLLPHRTVLDNIALQLQLTGTSKKQSRQIARTMMKQVGLDPSLARRYPSQLSGGQQQRLGVARALCVPSDILLMDEPFSALDPVIRHELQDEVLRLHHENPEETANKTTEETSDNSNQQVKQAQSKKRTIVFVTHDINEAIRLADRIVLLSPGAVIEQDGTPDEVIMHPANDFVRRFVEAGRPSLRAQSALSKSVLSKSALPQSALSSVTGERR